MDDFVDKIASTTEAFLAYGLYEDITVGALIAILAGGIGIVYFVIAIADGEVNWSDFDSRLSSHPDVPQDVFDQLPDNIKRQLPRWNEDREREIVGLYENVPAPAPQLKSDDSYDYSNYRQHLANERLRIASAEGNLERRREEHLLTVYNFINQGLQVTQSAQNIEMQELKLKADRRNDEISAYEDDIQKDPEAHLSWYPDNYTYSPGVHMAGKVPSAFFYLGKKPNSNQYAGALVQRHIMTIAESQTGKNSTSITPNLILWPHNLVMIDPSGDGVRTTAAHRQGVLGQRLLIFDPYGITSGFENALCTINVLQGLDPNDPEILEKLEAIAEQLLILHDPKHGEWYDTAKIILIGLMAFVLIDEHHRGDLSEIYALLLLSKDDLMGVPALNEFGQQVIKDGKPVWAKPGLKQMLEAKGPLRDLRVACANELTFAERSMGQEAWKQCKRNLKWVASAKMKAAIRETNFDINSIAYEPTSLFIVLPPGDRFRQNSQFLKLVVSQCTGAMMNKFNARGEEGGVTTLFCLDEIFHLGNMENILGDLGTLFKTGAIIWGIWHTLEEAKKCYGDGWEIIYGASAIKEFFGLENALDCERVSKEIGEFRSIKAPYMMPHEVKEAVRKPQDGFIARRKIVVLPDKPRAVMVVPEMKPDISTTVEAEATSEPTVTITLPALPQGPASGINKEMS